MHKLNKKFLPNYLTIESMAPACLVQCPSTCYCPLSCLCKNFDQATTTNNIKVETQRIIYANTSSELN